MSSATSDQDTFSLPALLSLLLLTVLLGYSAGRLHSAQRSQQSTPITLETATGATVPVVEITGIADGYLRGSIQGDVRFFLAGQQILPQSGGVLLASPAPLLQETVSVLVPEGMHFVASSRGTKYYAVTEAAAQRITPENRIYFATAAAAEAAGYRR